MTERLFEPDVVQCPFPQYRKMQDECPVYQVPDDDLYLVLGYDDCVDVLTSPDVYSSKAGPGLRQKQSPAAKAVLAQGHRIVRTLLTNDPPSHRRYRRIVNKAFTPRRIAALAPEVTSTVQELISKLEQNESVDFVRDFAQPLPLIVIADFLGVPRDDLDIFKRWSDDAAEVLGGTLSEQRQIEVNTSLTELLQYFADRADDRRAAPSSDFLGALVEAEDGQLTTEEIIAIAYVVLVAGNETTVNLLSSTLLMLLERPAIMARVRADRSLIPSAVEEALRLQSPIQGFPRVATVDTEIKGVPVPAGSRVMVMIGAANRDPDHFEHPDDVNLESAKSAHISFGKGIHFCVGAALSRLEAEIALNALFDRFGSIEFARADFEPAYADNAILRSLLGLPIVLRE
ncbi:cytochrome P450 [Rhodococcus jostii]|uniref:Cytochrome P450 n=1 Tax=Rhodococcus jostii TaxID=132919 RepID=A0A1H5M050_RHOJO|nr:cytochrome P450 [Rhodococcus jostii]SEE82624.1 Cytochrome P450 [Rhodococcus jostii]